MPAFRSHSTDTVDEAWDAGEMRTRVREGEKREYYAKIFAWYDPDLDEGNKGTYKFIHHMVGAEGEPGAANVKACQSAIGVLNGARGGTKIPDADRQGVWDHVAKHLRDAGLEPAELNESAAPELAPASQVDFRLPEMLRQAQSSEAWAILPAALEAMLSRPLGQHVATDALLAVTRPGPKAGRVARVPVLGPISRRDSFWSMFFGGTSVEGLIKTLREVEADSSIGTVVLDIDSPGGTVSGIPELVGEVRRLRESKHVVALANSLMASAAYWMGSQADEVIATPEAGVGSVGVFAVHEDWSKAWEQAGLKLTYISAGKYKTEGNFDEPLSDEARAHIQGFVDDAYGLFAADVAKGRGVTAEAVRAHYGEGRVLTAKDAKAAGMVDRVAGYEETMRRLMGIKAASEDAVEQRIAGIDGSESASGDASHKDASDGDLARLANLRLRLDLADAEFKIRS
jgi:signal peptide peptidase SppA